MGCLWILLLFLTSIVTVHVPCQRKQWIFRAAGSDMIISLAALEATRYLLASEYCNLNNIIVVPEAEVPEFLLTNDVAKL